ncbi:MAG TPA: helix-turn-helix domain-containing protein [Thermoanaerobaculia bacterium]
MAEESLNGQLCRLVGELVRHGVTLEQGRREFEKQFVLASLRATDGSLGRSARGLGVHRNTLRNMVSRLGIDVEEHGLRGNSKRRASKADN